MNNYVKLGDSVDKIKRFTIEYEEAKKVVESIGEYCGFACYWDFQLDLDLKFKLGYYYRPNLSDKSLFDYRCSSDVLDNEIKSIILKNIKNIAKEALHNIEKRLIDEQLIADKLIKEHFINENK
jgi:hypothetical protein